MDTTALIEAIKASIRNNGEQAITGDTLQAVLINIATTLNGGKQDAGDYSTNGALTEGLAKKADSATTLAGYGIGDAYTKTETDAALAKKADKGTTLDAYGITDGATRTELSEGLAKKADKTALEEAETGRATDRDRLEDAIVEAVGGDDAELPTLCGQPSILFGAGTPQEAVVPDNWRQFDPETGEGYNWNGTPSALGQQYIDTSVTTGGRYIAVPSGDAELKWVNS